MRRCRRIGILACLALLSSERFVAAHHSVAAYYDTNQQLTLKGTVTVIEWTNPHAFVHIDVRDEQGAVTNWSIETDSPNVLSRAGWSKTTLKINDQVTVIGYPAKKQSAAMRLVTLALADGRKLKG
jgi:V8-like Glu-specific endopeptidase